MPTSQRVHFAVEYLGPRRWNLETDQLQRPDDPRPFRETHRYYIRAYQGWIGLLHENMAEGYFDRDVSSPRSLAEDIKLYKRAVLQWMREHWEERAG